MAEETTETRENARKVREGLVTSNAMDKTAVVDVQTRKPHPRYRKTMARTTRLYVHDEENTLTRDFVRRVQGALEAGEADAVYDLVEPLHPADIADLGAIQLVRHQRPRRHRDEQHAKHPTEYAGTGHGHDPGAGGTGQGVVGQRRDEDAEDDRHGLAEARGKDEGQQLRLVADLGDGDGTGGGEESGH